MRFDLTEQEKIVYKYLVETDLTVKQIGKKLFLSEATIATHRMNIYQKLNITKRSALVRYHYGGLLNAERRNKGL